MILTFNQDKKDELSSSESIIFDTLSQFGTDNVLNLSTLGDEMRSQAVAKWFVKRVKTWKEKVEEESKEKLDMYFNSKGSEIAKYLGFFGFIAGIILLIIAMSFTTYEIRIEGLNLSVIIIITGVVAFVLPDDYLGSWTREGRIMHMKWENFKNFLKDNSLISEHPPQSIVIWKKYLIYGAAMGIADEVYKSMQTQIPDISQYDSDGLLLYHSYGGVSTMDSAIKSGEYWADPPDSGGGSGGSGGFGGGSGGGGGGAF